MILSLAEAGFFRPCWSAAILDETERAIATILKDRGDETPDATAARHRAAIERAFPESCVDGYQALIPAFTLPDPNDRHVLAAAVQTRASVIVTENLADFPSESVAPLEILVSSTDDFLADVIDLDTPGTVAAIRTMRTRLKRPELGPEALIRRMESSGLTKTANLLIGEIESL
jgi:hypothetical protein